MYKFAAHDHRSQPVPFMLTERSAYILVKLQAPEEATIHSFEHWFTATFSTARPYLTHGCMPMATSTVTKLFEGWAYDGRRWRWHFSYAVVSELSPNLLWIWYLTLADEKDKNILPIEWVGGDLEEQSAHK